MSWSYKRKRWRLWRCGEERDGGVLAEDESDIFSNGDESFGQ